MNHHTQGLLQGQDEHGKFLKDHDWHADYDGPAMVAHSVPLHIDGKVIALVVADSEKTGTDEELLANARRLVACWNAFNGVPTEDIEAAK